MGSAASTSSGSLEPAAKQYIEYIEVLKGGDFATMSVEQKAGLVDKFQKELTKAPATSANHDDARADNKESTPPISGAVDQEVAINGSAEQTPSVPVAVSSEEALKAVFFKFALYGKGNAAANNWKNESVDIDGSKFAKLCLETKLVGKRLTKTDVDMIFTKVKTKGTRKIGFASFLIALQKIAEKKQASYDSIVSAVVSSGGPESHGTIAGPARFYDDKSTWGQGVHAHGGPSTIDNRITLSNLADRTEADVRGRKIGHTSVA